MSVKALLFATLAGLAPVAGAAHAQDHSRHEHQVDVHAAVAVPQAGQRWHADAPLREGMARVRAASEALAAIDRNPVD